MYVCFAIRAGRMPFAPTLYSPTLICQGSIYLSFFLSLLFSGFDDAFRAIERLSMYVFDLPVDVAVKQFKDMNEAF